MKSRASLIIYFEKKFGISNFGKSEVAHPERTNSDKKDGHYQASSEEKGTPRWFPIICSFLLFCSPLLGEIVPDLYVQLERQHTLVPVAIDLQGEKSAFERNYLQKLEEVLSFDLQHNGSTYVASKEESPFYNIKMYGCDKKLTVALYYPHTEKEKTIQSAFLSGSLNEDRRLIHEMADAIHLELFDSRGVATTRFLFTRRTKEGQQKASDLWEADYDGKNSHRLFQNSGYCLTPIYLPPKTGAKAASFFFVSYRSGESKIYAGSRGEKTARLLYKWPFNQMMPAISRQRDRLAFIWDITGKADLFIQRFDPEKGPYGKPQQLFTSSHATQASPTFSPDGRKIAFVSNKDGQARIYILTLPPFGELPANPTLLTKCNRECTAPAWSPDGKKIAYCSRVGEARQICVWDFETDQESVLTAGPRNKENPTWAPNSLHLLYNTSDQGACEIYLVDMLTRQPLKLELGPGEKRFPNWEP